MGHQADQNLHYRWRKEKEAENISEEITAGNFLNLEILNFLNMEKEQISKSK